MLKVLLRQIPYLTKNLYLFIRERALRGSFFYLRNAITGSIFEASMAGEIPAIIPIPMAIEIPNVKIEKLKKTWNDVR